MGLLDQLVEDRIRAAVARGDLRGLPGEGRPLCFDEDVLVPPELRMAYRVLRNGGGVPPEVLALREATGLAQSVAAEQDAGLRAAGLRRLEALLQSLEAAGLGRTSTRVLAQYQEQVLARLATGPSGPASPHQASADEAAFRGGGNGLRSY